jgi:hypothetical protein
MDSSKSNTSNTSTEITNQYDIKTQKLLGVHEQTMNSMSEINKMLAQCEENGTTTLQQLSIDREKLLEMNKKIDGVDEKLNFSRRLINKMIRASDKAKIIAGVTGTLIVGAVITVGVFLKKK